MFTFIEMYNDDMMINHHGFQRNVPGVTNDLFFVQSAKGQIVNQTEKKEEKVWLL